MREPDVPEGGKNEHGSGNHSDAYHVYSRSGRWCHFSKANVHPVTISLLLVDALYNGEANKVTYRVRPSLDDYSLNIAWVVSRLANCLRRSVGTLLIVDQSIISTGYNRTPTGVKSCSEGGCASCASNVLYPQMYQHCLCISAEHNAVILAARRGVIKNYATLYTALCPCLECFKFAVQTGIREIVFDRDRPCDFQ